MSDWRYIIIVTVLFLTGCIREGEPSNEAQVLLDYKCTMAQLKLVEYEFNICKGSSYFDSYCYSTAKKTQCSRIEPPNEPKE